jgi:hypothetical protein
MKYLFLASYAAVGLIILASATAWESWAGLIFGLVLFALTAAAEAELNEARQ